MRNATKLLLRLLTLFAALALITAACGDSSGDDGGDSASSDDGGSSDDDGGSSDGDGGSDSDLSVAIVAPSASDDLAFTQSMVESVRALGIEPQITDGTFIVEDAAAAIRGYAEDGVDVVIAHGTQYGGSLEEIAPDFPETSFIWGTATDTKGLDNVYAYFPEAEQGGYVNGVMAAQLTDSGTIGVVGPVQAGDAVAYIEGFTKGAESEGATVNVVYTESFSDVALAAETAEGHLANGADVMTGTAQMVVGAVNVAQENDVLWFGTQANQTDLGSDVVVASQVYKWDAVLETMFSQIEDGTLGGEAMSINLANGGLAIEFNDGFDLPAEVKTLGEETVAGVIDGSIDPN